MSETKALDLFESVEDINQKLGSCVVFYKKEPLYIREAASISSSKLGILGIMLPLGDNATVKVGIEDPDLDYRTISSSLGYTTVSLNSNSGLRTNQSIFLTRMAVRKSVQGLHKCNVNVPKFRDYSFPGQHPHDSASYSWDFLIREKALADTLGNKYPSLKSAKESLGKSFDNKNLSTLHSVAFNRNFAINKRPVGPYYLEYKGKDIAWSEDLARFSLDKSFAFLQETLEYNNIAIK